MLGQTALVDGLGGASPNPVESTAADLTANSSQSGNDSAQLSVEDLASGSHDPAMQGASPMAATAPVSSASLPLPPQQQFQQVYPGYESVPMPGSNEISFGSLVNVPRLINYEERRDVSVALPDDGSFRSRWAGQQTC